MCVCIFSALQGWADAVMLAAEALPDGQHAQEQTAKTEAISVLERAVHAFQQVGGPAGGCIPGMLRQSRHAWRLSQQASISTR